ncbi:kinase-like domain-containing protein [Melanogaster broomeanus]|nr:kinase-like domain-containing protein [Melanogaster broomeanus]
MSQTTPRLSSQPEGRELLAPDARVVSPQHGNSGILPQTTYTGSIGSVQAFSSPSILSSYQTASQWSPSATQVDARYLRILHKIFIENALTILSSRSLPTDRDTQPLDSIPYENLTNRIRKQNMFPTSGGGGSCPQSKMLCRELSVWARLRHENVLPFYGVAFGFGPLPAIVGPWAHNGTLGDYLACRPGLPTSSRAQLLCEIASGLHYPPARLVHTQMVIHGDLTGTNVLIDASGKAYLSDFGHATIHHEFLGTSFFSSSYRCNVRWAAPELFEVPEHEGSRSVLCSEEADVYSYGSIMLQVLSGKVPFFGFRIEQVYGQVSVGHRPPRESCWNGERIPDVYWRFIQRCWDKVPSRRPSSFEVLEFIRSRLTETE